MPFTSAFHHSTALSKKKPISKILVFYQTKAYMFPADQAPSVPSSSRALIVRSTSLLMLRVNQNQNRSAQAMSRKTIRTTTWTARMLKELAEWRIYSEEFGVAVEEARMEKEILRRPILGRERFVAFTQCGEGFLDVADSSFMLSNLNAFVKDECKQATLTSPVYLLYPR